jgi:hypothetical protein
MSNRLIVAALMVCLATSVLNIAILLRQEYKPIRPVNVDGVLAKDWLKAKQFKKAVEEIAGDVVDGYDHLDKEDVEKLIESCTVRAGRITC